MTLKDYQEEAVKTGRYTSDVVDRVAAEVKHLIPNDEETRVYIRNLVSAYFRNEGIDIYNYIDLDEIFTDNTFIIKHGKLCSSIKSYFP